MFSRAQQHFRMRWHRPLANQHQGKGPQEVPNGSASQFAALLSAATKKKEGHAACLLFLSNLLRAQPDIQDVHNPCGKVQGPSCANRGLQACFYGSLPFSEQQCSAFLRQMQCKCHSSARSEHGRCVTSPLMGQFLPVPH